MFVLFCWILYNSEFHYFDFVKNAGPDIVLLCQFASLVNTEELLHQV